MPIFKSCHQHRSIFSSTATTNTIELYPNPTNGKATLRMSGYNDVTHLRIVVTNTLGTTWELKRDTWDDPIPMDFGNQPSGLYLVSVYIDNELTKQYKLILNK